VSRFKNLVLGFSGVLIFFIIWNIYSEFKKYPVFPKVQDIFKTLFEVATDGTLFKHFSLTVLIALQGLFYSILIAVVVGIAMGESQTIKAFLKPIVYGFRGIAGVTIIPILIVVFGIGDFSRIFIFFWTSFPPILINSISAIHQVDKELIEVSETMGANRMYILINVKLPLALNTIFEGIKIGMGTGWISLVVAEMFGATGGLGYMIVVSTSLFQFKKTYAFILIITITLVLFTFILDYVQKKVIKKIFQ
jgi:NitT/TauT family transport system permease protein